MENKLALLNKLKEIRVENKISQTALADMVGVSRNTISSIETGQYSPTAKLAYSLCIALNKKFEDVFYFENFTAPSDICSEQEDDNAEKSSLSDKAIQRIKEYMLSQGWTAEQILDFIIFITK